MVKQISGMILAVCMMMSPGVGLAQEWDELRWNFGPLQLNAPFQQVDVTYLHDFIAQRNLAGAETPIVNLWHITGTIGAVTSIDGEGAPYIGGHMDITNPINMFLNLGDLRLGGWGAYNFIEGQAMVGLKAGYPLF